MKSEAETRSRIDDGQGNSHSVSARLGATASIVDSPPGANPATRVITARIDASASTGGTVPGVGASAGTSAEAVYQIEITAPAGTDLDTIDPDRPETWPPGTRVVKHRTNAVGVNGEIDVKAGWISAGAGVSRKDAHGTTEVMEKKADGSLEVSTGPTSAWTEGASFEVGLGGVISAEVKNTEVDRNSATKTASFDLTTEEGRRAFEAYQQSGQLPTANGPGVSGVSETTRSSTEQDSTLALKILGFKVGEGELSNELKSSTTTRYPDGRVVQVDERVVDGQRLTIRTETRPDGSKSRTETLHSGSAPNDGSYVLTEELDPSGKHVEGSPKQAVRFTVKEESVEATNQRIDELNAADGGKRPHVRAGDQVELPSDEATAKLMNRSPELQETLIRLGQGGAFGRYGEWMARRADPEMIDYARSLGLSDDEIDAAMAGDWADPSENRKSQAPRPWNRIEASEHPYLADSAREDNKAILQVAHRIAAETGMPLDRAINLVRTRFPQGGAELKDIAWRLSQGRPLSEALDPGTKGLVEAATQRR